MFIDLTRMRQVDAAMFIQRINLAVVVNNQNLINVAAAVT